MLASLQATLKRLGAERERQAALVAEIEAPRRKLAEIEAQERAAADQLAQAEARIVQKSAELSGVREDLRFLAAAEAELQARAAPAPAIERLVESGRGNVNLADLNRTQVQTASTLEWAEQKRAEEQRLITELRALGVAKP